MVGSEGVHPDVFRGLYEDQAPWDTGRPQPAVMELLERGLLRSPVLDMGCGAGENLILLSMSGFETVGIDLVPKAIAMARARAAERDITIDARVADALQASRSVEGPFRSILDSGVFHVFGDEDRQRYLQQLRRLTAPGGYVFVIVFRDDEPGSDGPRRISEAELRLAFKDGFVCEAVEPTRYELAGGQAKAWLGIFRRDGVETG